MKIIKILFIMKTTRFFIILSALGLFAGNAVAQEQPQQIGEPTPALATVQQCYKYFGEGNISGLLGKLSEEVTWVDPGHVGPYAGKRLGKAAVLDFFTQLNEQLNITQFEPHDIFTMGGKVAVTGYVGGTAKATGAPFATDWAMAWEVDQDGKVIYHHLYLDTDNIGKAIASKNFSQTGSDFLTAMDANDFNGLIACVSPDFKIYHPNFPQPLSLKDFFDMQVKPFNAAFQNMTHKLLDISCEGQKLSMRGTVSGKHVGELMGIPPTGNDIEVPWLAFASLDANGKIKALHIQFNQLAFLAQLGVNPMAQK